LNTLKLILITLILAVPSWAVEPQIIVKDLRIDDRLVTNHIAAIDTTSGTQPENWTAIIFDLDIKIPEGAKINKFEKGKWLDHLKVKWEFLYKPPHFKDNIGNYMRFSRSVEYGHIEEGSWKISLLIEPAVMKRYFDRGSYFKSHLLTKITVMHKGELLDTHFFQGERADSRSEYHKAFLSVKSYLFEGILKTRPETPFRNLQTAKFLIISKK
jgi:hypothetical protein